MSKDPCHAHASGSAHAAGGLLLQLLLALLLLLLLLQRKLHQELPSAVNTATSLAALHNAACR